MDQGCHFFQSVGEWRLVLLLYDRLQDWMSSLCYFCNSTPPPQTEPRTMMTNFSLLSPNLLVGTSDSFTRPLPMCTWSLGNSDSIP